MNREPGTDAAVEAPVEDRVEQGTPPAADPGVEVPLEAVDADVVEQAAETAPGSYTETRDLPLEADPADVAEQGAGVELDEDERR
ncbi:MAG: hypothetical protein AVDCRST_MAG16-1872 [uncultured Frankineae bacterium]|uniref:DUF5709 domain-containing protein n=1 Tax=uncultured Frankineae bacterium TaxID=437475 RepID=A0A6J4LU65_9ACTN|nr:MAG: hypothetical protein AVDCRST_MAG16-1872 [uncultured Frankineae bacterium]